jgi:hypothetical protein
MKPILSRFCEIYVPEPEVNGECVNLYKYNINQTFNMKDIKTHKLDSLKKEILKSISSDTTLCDLMTFATKMYEKGYSALDMLALLENHKFLESTISLERRYELLTCFNRVRREFRNEKLLLLFILNFIFLSSEFSLENISFM